MEPFKNISILGVGLIGGSLGMALKQFSSSVKVTGLFRRKEAIAEAKKVGAIDVGTTNFKEGLKNADLVFICTPVSTIVPLIKEIIPYLKEGTVITDVGSVKSSIVHSVGKFLPPHLHFIGGHPLAGSERGGVQAAFPTLFKNAFYIITPTQKTNTEALKLLHSLLTQIGANVIAIDPDRHDRIVAFISHLPHLLACSLVNLAASQATEVENLLLFAATGFRDMTRIAAGNPGIWADICLENKKAIDEAIEEFQKEILKIRSLIRDNKKEKLYNQLDQARQARVNLPTVLYKDLSQLRDLLIPVTDKPGVLSEVTVAIGRLGINIEDIEIIHGKGRGILKITLVGQQNAIKSARELRKIGYEVRILKTVNSKVY